MVVQRNESETVFGKLSFYNSISAIRNSNQILHEIVRNKIGFILFHWSHFYKTLIHVREFQVGVGTSG
jgi:hypothetical protein